MPGDLLVKIIKERRTVHAFKKEPLAENILHQGLELATYAPNHKKTFPYLFIHLGPEIRSEFSKLAVDIKAEKDPQLSEIKLRALLEKFNCEGELIFFVQKLADDEFTCKEDYATMACAIQNFSLYLSSMSLAVKWSTGAFTRDQRTYDLLNIDKSTHEIAGMIWAGHPLQVPAVVERPNWRSRYFKTS